MNQKKTLAIAKPMVGCLRCLPRVERQQRHDPAVCAVGPHQTNISRIWVGTGDSIDSTILGHSAVGDRRAPCRQAD